MFRVKRHLLQLDPTCHQSNLSLGVEDGARWSNNETVGAL